MNALKKEYDKGYNDGFADGANNFEDKLLVEAIANYMVVNGCASTTSCNRIFTFDEIAEHFQITADRLNDLKDDIVDELYGKAQICDQDGVWIEDDAFNLMFFGNYCDVNIEED